MKFNNMYNSLIGQTDIQASKSIIMYLNVLGGTILLDYYSKDELITIIEDYTSSMMKVKLPLESETVVMTDANA